MTKRNGDGELLPIWEAAEEILVRPTTFPEPADLDLAEWLRRVPTYLEEIAALAEPLSLLRLGDAVDVDERRLIDALVTRLPALRRRYEAVVRIADERDTFAETFYPTREPFRNWQRDHALRMWRDGDRQVAQRGLTSEQTLLLPVLVLDAACWRRARQLVANLPARPADEPS